MLPPNLVNALDMAAANGVLDYDGAAYITGTRPRYAGSPEFSLSGNIPSTNLQQPQKDQMIYTNNNKQPSANPLWKKMLFGALVIGAGVFGFNKLKKLPSIKNFFKDAGEKIKNIKKPDTSKLPSVKECYTKVCDFFKDNWNKLFKKKSAPTP